MKKHLAIMDKQTIEAILGGVKTVEACFSKTKIAPFAQVFAGDLVYLKPPRGEVIGQFRVKKVIFCDNCNLNDLSPLGYFGKKYLRFATLIFIGESERFITSPIKIQKSGQKNWTVLE